MLLVDMSSISTLSIVFRMLVPLRVKASPKKD
jgi:hypothetical protein